MRRDRRQDFRGGRRLRRAGHSGKKRGARIRLTVKEQFVDPGTCERENLLRVRVPGRTVSNDRDTGEQRPEARHCRRGGNTLEIVRLDQNADESRATIGSACLERRDRVDQFDGRAATQRIDDAKPVRRLSHESEKPHGRGTSEIWRIVHERAAGASRRLAESGLRRPGARRASTRVTTRRQECNTA